MELGETVCTVGTPSCARCPVAAYCAAHRCGEEALYPVLPEKKPRRIENRRVLLLLCGDACAVQRRADTGLLASMWELPNDLLPDAPETGEPCGEAVHIFSHVEWHMTGYELLVDELEKTSAPNVGQMCVENGADGSENIFVKIKQLEEEYAMPSAFDKFVEHTRFS